MKNSLNCKFKKKIYFLPYSTILWQILIFSLSTDIFLTYFWTQIASFSGLCSRVYTGLQNPTHRLPSSLTHVVRVETFCWNEVQKQKHQWEEESTSCWLSQSAGADRAECVEDPGADKGEKTKLNLNTRRAFILELILTSMKQGRMRENRNIY